LDIKKGMNDLTWPSMFVRLASLPTTSNFPMQVLVSSRDGNLDKENGGPAAATRTIEPQLLRLPHTCSIGSRSYAPPSCRMPTNLTLYRSMTGARDQGGNSSGRRRTAGDLPWFRRARGRCATAATLRACPPPPRSNLSI